VLRSAAVRPLRLAALGLAATLAACGAPSVPDAGTTPDSGATPEVDAGAALQGDPSRDILSTALSLDLGTRHGTARIAVGGDGGAGASFEVGDLSIATVTGASGPLRWSRDGGWLDVEVGPAATSFTVDYTFQGHSNFDGWLPANGLSFLWPYFCGNLFPCHSAPADGLTFTMAVTGVPSGKTAVFPATIPADAPSYMPAIAVGDYTYTRVGSTDAGTEVGVYSLPGHLAQAQAGTQGLDLAFDWYERTLGPYTFGAKVASVEAAWGPGGYGGMEHHPFWHVAQGSMGDRVTHYHEAAHGWFGDGVRIQCWEDFVLSEGTVSYLAARAMKEVQNVDVWADYQTALDDAIAAGDTVALPSTCNAIDLLTDPLWSDIPYMKGAFFFRAVEQQVGAAALDRTLSKFYRAHVGGAARMQDLLDAIKTETGFDPTALANAWLRSLGHP
jgi:hypothetical protein